MRKKVIILIIIAIILTGCSRNIDDLTIKNGILMIGLEVGYPPMEYIAADGLTLTGFDVFLGREIAKKLGLEAQFIDTAWDLIFDGVNLEKYDCIISSVTITSQRLQNFNFSKPYLQNTLAIVMQKDSNHQVRSPQDLGGLRVGYQSQTTSDDYMTELRQKDLVFTQFEYDNIMFCFDDLRFNRLDAVITDIVVGMEYIARSDTLEIVWQGEEEEFGICIKKGNDALTQAINTALDELYEDGTLLQISRDFFNGRNLVSAVRQ